MTWSCLTLELPALINDQSSESMEQLHSDENMEIECEKRKTQDIGSDSDSALENLSHKGNFGSDPWVLPIQFLFFNCFNSKWLKRIIIMVFMTEITTTSLFFKKFAQKGLKWVKIN